MMTIKPIRRWVLWQAALFMLLFILISSCRKGQTSDVDIPQAEKTIVRISVDGIVGSSNSQAKAKGENLAGGGLISSSSRASKFVVHGAVGFDYYSKEESADHQARISSSQAETGSNGATSANTILGSVLEPMRAGRNYRVIFYNMSSGQAVFAGAKDMVAGISDSLSLQKGVPYRWMAYSYDSDEPMPSFTGQNVPTFIDRAFISDEGGTFTIPMDQTAIHKVNVVFKQRLARVGIRINAHGATAQKITAVEGTYAGPEPLKLYKGSFDLIGNQLSVGQQVVIDTGTTLYFQNENEDEAVKCAYFYTAVGDGEWSCSLMYNLTSLKIKLLPSTNFPSGQEISVLTCSTPFAFYGFSKHSAGKSSTGVIELGAGGAELGSLIWSLGNLYYENGLYRFRTDGLFNYFNTTTGAENNSSFIKSFGNTDYWFWMSAQPDQTRVDFNLDRVDPCSLVLPKGAWRMPTGAEYLSLNAYNRRSIDGATREVVQFCDGCGGSTNASWTDGSKSIFTFKADGRWQPSVAAGSIAGYGGPWSESLAYDTYALFWTADYFPYVNGTVNNVNKQSIKLTNYARHEGGTISLQQALTGDPLGVRRYQIRCVRPK